MSALHKKGEQIWGKRRGLAAHPVSFPQHRIRLYTLQFDHSPRDCGAGKSVRRRHLLPGHLPIAVIEQVNQAELEQRVLKNEVIVIIRRKSYNDCVRNPDV